MAYNPELSSFNQSPEIAPEVGGNPLDPKFTELVEEIRNATTIEQLDEIRRAIEYAFENEGDAREALRIFDELAAQRTEEM